MAEYGKLFSRIWSDPEFTALDARSQQVYALLISHSSRNLAGVLPLTLKRWARSTIDATIDNLTDALKQLAANKFLVIDWDTEEVLIRTFIRNDEVYRQPNLMKSARKLARQVQSPSLRWALHDELTRLPEHKDDNDTVEVAKSLIKGLPKPLTEPFGEPFSEGLTEPMPEGWGVGVSYVGKGNTSTYTDQLSPTPAAAAIPEPNDAQAATSGADLVRAVIPREHPDAVKTLLRMRASELINSGTPRETVEAALQLWLAKPNVGPNVLPSLVSEVIKLRNGHTQPPATRKVNVGLQLAEKLGQNTPGLEA
jgi:hypothetical protein